MLVLVDNYTPTSDNTSLLQGGNLSPIGYPDMQAPQRPDGLPQCLPVRWRKNCAQARCACQCRCTPLCLPQPVQVCLKERLWILDYLLSVVISRIKNENDVAQFFEHKSFLHQLGEIDREACEIMMNNMRIKNERRASTPDHKVGSSILGNQPRTLKIQCR